MTLEAFLNELVPSSEWVEVFNKSGIGGARVLCDAEDVWTAGDVLESFFCYMYEVVGVYCSDRGGTRHLRVVVRIIEDEED